MDEQKKAYFVARYRQEDEQELAALAHMDLSEEAQAALEQVCAERGINVAASQLQTTRSGTPSESPEQVQAKTRESQALWDGPLAKTVQHLSFLNGTAFAVTFLNTAGIAAGAVGTVAAAGIMGYATNRAGRAYTKSVCANADASIEMKTRQLRSARWVVGGGIFLSAIAAAMVGGALR